MSRYMVLSLDGGGYAYADREPIEAPSGEAAIRKLGEPGTYVAVPERSWRPVELRTETVTRVTVARPEPTLKSPVKVEG